MATRRSVRAAALVALGAALWAGAGCAWLARPRAAPPRAAEVVVDMHEFRFEPERLSLAAGRPVVLTLRNRGSTAHELRIGRGPQGGAGYREDILAASQVRILRGRDYRVEGVGAPGEAGGARIVVQPGGEVTLQLTIPARRRGSAEMGCFIPGHYEAGMRGSVTVR